MTATLQHCNAYRAQELPVLKLVYIMRFLLDSGSEQKQARAM